MRGLTRPSQFLALLLSGALLFNTVGPAWSSTAIFLSGPQNATPSSSLFDQQALNARGLFFTLFGSRWSSAYGAVRHSEWRYHQPLFLVRQLINKFPRLQRIDWPGAVRLLQRLPHRWIPILGDLPPEDVQTILQNAEKWRDEKAEETGHQLTDTAKYDWEKLLKPLGGGQIRIHIFRNEEMVPGAVGSGPLPAVPLIRYRYAEDGVLDLGFKESIFTDITNLDRRNIVIAEAILVARARAAGHRLLKWPLKGFVRAIGIHGNSSGLSDSEARDDFLHMLLAVFSWKTARQVWQQARELVGIPPTTFDRIMEAFQKNGLPHTDRDERMVAICYDLAGNSSKTLDGGNALFASKRSLFSKDSTVSFDLAQMGEEAPVLAAGALVDIFHPQSKRTLEGTVQTVYPAGENASFEGALRLKDYPHAFYIGQHHHLQSAVFRKGRLVSLTDLKPGDDVNIYFEEERYTPDLLRTELRTRFERKGLADADADYIVNLVLALQRLRDESFYREIPPSSTRYDIERSSDRFLEVTDRIAAEYEVGFSQLASLFLADQAHQPSTFDMAKDAERLKRSAFETLVTFAYTAERLGYLTLPQHLLDEAFRHYQPDLRNRVRKLVLQARGLTHHQAELELDRLEARLQAALQVNQIPPVRIGEKEVQIRTDEKTYFSSLFKMLEGRLFHEPEVAISKQKDLLRLMAIVPDDAIEKIPAVLEAFQNGEPELKLMPDRTRIHRLKGKPAYLHMNFSYKNPKDPNAPDIVFELQIMTESYYPIYLSGLSPARYEQPHGQRSGARRVGLVTQGADPRHPEFGQKFSRQDPRLTLNYNQDVQAIRDHFRPWIHPAYTVLTRTDELSTLKTALDKDDDMKLFNFAETELPAGAILADLQLDSNVSSDNGFYDAYRIRYEKDTTQPKGFRRTLEPISVLTPLQPGDAIVIDKSKPLSSEATRLIHWPHLLGGHVKSPAAYLRLTKMFTSEQRQALIQGGQSILIEDYGTVAGAFREQAILPAATMFGLTEEEFYLALALDQSGGSTPCTGIFKTFQEWYRVRFVNIEFDAHQPSLSLPTEYAIQMYADDDQIGLLADAGQVLKGLNATLISVDARRYGDGTAGIQFSIRTTLPLETVLQTLRQSIVRKRRERVPDSNARRFEINLTLSKSVTDAASAHYAIMQLLSDLNIDITSLRLKAGGRVMKLVTLVPPTLKPRNGHKGPAMGVLKQQLEDLALNNEKLIKPEDLDIGECFTDATAKVMNEILKGIARQLPQKDLQELKFDPFAKAPEIDVNEVDYVAVAEFEKIMREVQRVLGPADPNDPLEGRFAATKYRQSDARFITHCINTTWILLNISHCRDLQRVLAEPAHDMFEDGPRQIRLVHPDWSDERAREQIEQWFREGLPTPTANAVLEIVWKLSRKPGHYLQNRDALVESAPDLLPNKYSDVIDNSSDGLGVNKAIRFWLSPLTRNELWNAPEQWSLFQVFLKTLVLQTIQLDKLSPYYQREEDEDDQAAQADIQMLHEINDVLTWWRQQQMSTRRFWRKADLLVRAVSPEEIKHFVDLLKNLRNSLAQQVEERQRRLLHQAA